MQLAAIALLLAPQATEWSSFQLGGVHPFAGVGIMGGPSLPFSLNALASKNARNPVGPIDGSFLLALRGGIYAGRNEFAIELSPMTYLMYGGYPSPGYPGPGTSFQLAFEYTGLVPLFEGPKLGVYWPFRVGCGFATSNYDAAFLQLRIDVSAVAFRIGHVMLDFSLPSFRYLYSPGDTSGNLMFFTWLPGVHANYVF